MMLFHDIGDTITEKTLIISKDDKVSSITSYSKVAINVPGKPKKVETDVLTVTVQGCSIGEVNGRYLEHGTACYAKKFSNVNGWHIFRNALEEIPELDILASNCYTPLLVEGQGETISERMYKRTGKCATDVLLKDVVPLIFNSLQILSQQN